MAVSVLAHKTCSGIGEGPYWDEYLQCLFYVDISAKEIHRFDTNTSKDTKVTLRKYLNYNEFRCCVSLLP